jgi:hypothetical protein
LLCFVLTIVASPFKSKSRLEAEKAALRQQLIVLRRKVQGPGPAHEQRSLVLYPAGVILPVLTIIRPETLVRLPVYLFWAFSAVTAADRADVSLMLFWNLTF